MIATESLQMWHNPVPNTVAQSNNRVPLTHAIEYHVARRPLRERGHSKSRGHTRSPPRARATGTPRNAVLHRGDMDAEAAWDQQQQDLRPVSGWRLRDEIQ